VPKGGLYAGSSVGDGEGTGDGAALTLVLTFVETTGWFVFSCLAFISPRRGLTTKKKMAANAPPLINKNKTTPKMISGAFDFFFAGAAAAGAEAAGAAAVGAGVGGGVVIGADG